MQGKVRSLSKAADLIQDGMLLAVGGNAMHRNPTRFFLELATRPVKNLKLCAAAIGIAGDILVATHQVDTAYFGFFGLENEAGLAPGMRRAMEKDGSCRAVEGS